MMFYLLPFPGYYIVKLGRHCVDVCVCISRHIFEINGLIEIRDGLGLMSCSEELFSTYFISLFSNQTYTLYAKKVRFY